MYTAKLRGKQSSFLYMSFPHSCRVCPTANIPSQNGACYSCWTYTHCHLPFMFTLKFTLGAAHSLGLDKYIMTWIHHYSITHSIFTALKILCAPPVHSSLLPTPGNH